MAKIITNNKANTYTCKHLKPSTKYTISFTRSSNVKLTIDLAGSVGHTTGNSIILTTPSTLKHEFLQVEGEKINEVVITEGEQVVNYDYFEGVKSIGEEENGAITFRAPGKNLFDVSKGSIGSISTINGSDSHFGNRRYRSGYIQVNPNTQYTLRMFNAPSDQECFGCFYDYNNILIGSPLLVNPKPSNGFVHTVTSPNNAKHFRFRTQDLGYDLMTNNEMQVIFNEGSLIAYEPYKEIVQTVQTSGPIMRYDVFKNNGTIIRATNIDAEGNITKIPETTEQVAPLELRTQGFTHFFMENSMKPSSINVSTTSTKDRTDFMKIPNNKEISLSSNGVQTPFMVTQYDFAKNPIKTDISTSSFVSENAARYIKLLHRGETNIQVEQSPASTSYEQFRNDIITRATGPLRSVGDVKDQLLYDGTIIRNCGEDANGVFVLPTPTVEYVQPISLTTHALTHYFVNDDVYVERVKVKLTSGADRTGKIRVKPNSNIIISLEDFNYVQSIITDFTVAQYGINDDFIGIINPNANGIYRMSTNTHYIKLLFNKTYKFKSVDKLQVESNSVPTSYVGFRSDSFKLPVAKPLLSAISQEVQVVSFSDVADSDYRINVRSVPVVKTFNHTEYYPDMTLDPLDGIVNGVFDISDDGSYPMSEVLYNFASADSIYDKKYYCQIEGCVPLEAYVSYKFENQVEDDIYTTTERDKVTFTSDCIIEGDDKVKDFLMQVSEGPYVINDNLEHSFSYSLNGLPVDVSNYSKFEMNVETSDSDIQKTSSTYELFVNNNNLSANVNVSARVIPSSVSRWSPYIHAGYYYMNQNEYYMYNECNVETENALFNEVHISKNATAKLNIEASSSDTQIEYYDISKVSFEDLMTDHNKFELFTDNIYNQSGVLVERKLVSPKAVLEGFFYNEYDEQYVYYSHPFLFKKKPTSYGSFTYDTNGYPGMALFLQAYNSVVGKWEGDTPVVNGQIPPTLPKSQLVRIKAVMQPNRYGVLFGGIQALSCEQHWIKYMDEQNSSNIYVEEEVLTCLSPNTDGVFVSDIMDMGNAIDPTQRTFTGIIVGLGDIEAYIWSSDEKLDLSMDHSQFVPIVPGQETIVKRYLKVKIVLKPGAKVSEIAYGFKLYSNKVLPTYMLKPAIGNFRITATYDPSQVLETYSKVLSYDLPYDKQKHTVVGNMTDLISDMSKEYGFDLSNIQNINIENIGNNKDDYNVYFDYPITEEVEFESKFEILSNEYSEDNLGVELEVVNNQVKLVPAPQNTAPVIIKQKIGNDLSLLTPVFFLDEDYNYTLTNTESFDSLGFKTLYLQYYDIDITTLNVFIDGVKTFDYTLQGHVIEFTDNVPKGSVIDVSYRLNNSFCLNYAQDFESAIVDMHVSIPSDKVVVYFETNKETNLKKLSNISLNPVYNVNDRGYIFITDEVQIPSKLEIIPENNYIYCNGVNSMIVLIKVSDKYDNPVKNAKVNIESAAGAIRYSNNITDKNGIISCVYVSTDYECIDTVNAICTDKAFDTVIIKNRFL